MKLIWSGGWGREVELTYIEQGHLVCDVFVGRRGEDICVELLGHCQHIVEGRQVGKIA